MQRFSFGFRGKEKQKEESDTTHSNWWLLNSRKSAGAIRSRTDGISIVPPKPSTYLQPPWRQARPRATLLAQLSNAIFSVGGKGAALAAQRNPKKQENQKQFVADDDDDGLFEDVGGDTPHFGRFVINPRSLWKIIWDVMVLALTVAQLCTVFFRNFFECSQLDSGRAPGWAIYDQPSLLYIEFAMDIVYFVNMVFEVHCAYFVQQVDGEYQLYTSLVHIYGQYFTSFRSFLYFGMIVIGGTPWELMLHLWYNFKLGYGASIALHYQDPDKDWWTLSRKIFVHRGVVATRFARIMLLFQGYRVLVLTRIGRMDRYVQIIREQLAVRNGAVRVISFMSSFVISIHVIACFMFQLGTFYKQFLIDPLDPDPDSGTSWITESNIVTRTCVGEDVGGVMMQTCSSGRVRIVDTEMNLQSQYVVSLYWMTTTMTQVGYGDLTPRTEFEVLALIISMLAGAAIFSQIVGNATQMILEVKGHDAIVDQELDGPPLNPPPPTPHPPYCCPFPCPYCTLPLLTTAKPLPTPSEVSPRTNTDSARG